MSDKSETMLRVEIKSGWEEAGRQGNLLYPDPVLCYGQDWTPVLWDGEEDPTFIKTTAIDIFIRN